MTDPTVKLGRVANDVLTAADYAALFGELANHGANQAEQLKRHFRRLAKIIHPDGYPDPTDKLTAERAFAQLCKLYGQATEALKAGTYGRAATLATITTKRSRHELTRLLAEGDLCDLYISVTQLATGATQPTVCKVAKSPADKDLLEAEAAAIKRLRAASTPSALHPFVPVLVDTFAYGGRGQPLRQANVLARLEGFYDLHQVRRAYPDGLVSIDMAWIWRRLLFSLGHVHRLGLVHGAVLPAHVMILPAQHGVVLVDWCYSSIANADNLNPPIKAVVDNYRGWYPEEVIKKQAPSPATDIAMAARCMVWLMAGDPLSGNLSESRVPTAFRAFFKGCMSTRQAARPDDAWSLLHEFDELLERLGPPYFPRRFRPFAMPTGVV